jgi:hypothetical protein
MVENATTYGNPRDCIVDPGRARHDCMKSRLALAEKARSVRPPGVDRLVIGTNHSDRWWRASVWNRRSTVKVAARLGHAGVLLEPASVVTTARDHAEASAAG